VLTRPNALQKEGIEEDLDADDRGHSNSHPGYRRRQFRFLTWKLLSQFQSYLFYIVLAPVLRWGPNQHRFPLSESDFKFTGTILEQSLQTMGLGTFIASMSFSGAFGRVLAAPQQCPARVLRVAA